MRSADAFVRVALECGPGQGCWVIPPRLDLSPPSRPMPRAKTQRRRRRRSSSRRTIGKKSGWLAPWRQGSLHRLQLQRSLCPMPRAVVSRGGTFLESCVVPQKRRNAARQGRKSLPNALFSTWSTERGCQGGRRGRGGGLGVIHLLVLPGGRSTWTRHHSLHKPPPAPALA